MSQKKDANEKKNTGEKKNNLFMIIIFIFAMILLCIWKFGIGTETAESGSADTSETTSISREIETE